MRILSWLISIPIYAYRRLIRPLLRPRCRFYPSCSTYALEALRLHGPFVGSYMMIRRVLRCHPWRQGGLDPVPRL